jgi:cell wall-associated NlpC family hydrolase
MGVINTMWKYRVGFSLTEAKKFLGEYITDDDVVRLLAQHKFEYTYSAPRKIFQQLTPLIIGAEYKNPSIMQTDAPTAFSCSTLVSYFSTLSGMPWMPSTTVDKYVYLPAVTREQLEYGDLVFANSNEGKIHYSSVEWRKGTPVPEGVDHVGIYLGEGKVLHASRTIGKADIQDLDSAVSFKNIVGYRRIASIDEPRYTVVVPNEKNDLFSIGSLLHYLAHAPKDTDVSFINEVPHLSQLLDITDTYWTNRACGGVCLAMALSYFGRPIGDLDSFCSIAESKGYFYQTYGWAHQGLVELAREAGFNGYRSEGGTIEDIAKEVHLGNVPILSVSKKLFGVHRRHLVVAIGTLLDVSGEVIGIYVHDPETLYRSEQPQYVSRKLLNADWTKRYIVITKAP